jgi:hypothetical protein
MAKRVMESSKQQSQPTQYVGKDLRNSSQRP